MRGILIFDQINDIVYANSDLAFVSHMNSLAEKQGLVEAAPSQSSTDREDIDSAHFLRRFSKDAQAAFMNSNMILQLFSPLLASQRIMSGQCNNNYTSVQCGDGTTVMFGEFLGYQVLVIGRSDISFLTRLLQVFLQLVQFVCGPNVSLLKISPYHSDLLDNLIHEWEDQWLNQQSFLIEAVEQVRVSREMNTTAAKILQGVNEHVKHVPEFTSHHMLILVGSKLLSLYSSNGATELLPHEILLLILLSTVDMSVKKPGRGDVDSYLLMRRGYVHQRTHHYSSYTCHIAALGENIKLVIFAELNTSVLCRPLTQALLACCEFQHSQLDQGSHAVTRHSLDNLDSSMRRVIDSLRKVTLASTSVDHISGTLQSKWESIRRSDLSDYLRSPTSQYLPSWFEASISSLADSLREVFTCTCMDRAAMNIGNLEIMGAVSLARTKLMDYTTFLQVKAQRNVTLLGRSALSINKYLEEFPGLVHFIYVDRNLHQVTAPTIDFNAEETVLFTKNKVWLMVDFVHSHLQNGHLSLMWRDATFNYAYFLWFEDNAGSPLKIKKSPQNFLKDTKKMTLPGILTGDFYRSLINECFPGVSTKVRCYELYCIHLGLATSTCILEQTRRLAATICEVTGEKSSPMDLL